ncbi:MAG: TerD family protein [Rhodocyclaceae bacterium]|nr:TerD family protein [Rhodocyclaceae bacterium]
MAISLQKGGNVNLSKEAPSMKKMLLGLGWNARATDGTDFDLDASAFLLNATGKVRSDADFIFYNQPKSTEGSVQHSGDNRTGAGEGDDEAITVDLAQVPADVEKISVCVTIHSADERRQNFGMVSSAYIRCVDAVSNTEIAKYDLSEDASVETAMIFGEIYRHGGDWKFKAIGQGFQGGLAPLAKNFGVNV